MTQPQKKNPRAPGRAKGAKKTRERLPRNDTTGTATSKAPSRQKAWRQAHPARYLAHLYIEAAKRLGVISPQPCAVCGATKVDAHHDDYSKPGEVRWLCRRHHTQLHARRR